MSTSAITHVHDSDEKSPIIFSMYRHCDGYPEGHGKDLESFCEGFVVGIGMGMNPPKKFANGMDCFALQMVCHFKKEPGNFYAAKEDNYADYFYHVYKDKETKRLMVKRD